MKVLHGGKKVILIYNIFSQSNDSRFCKASILSPNQNQSRRRCSKMQRTVASSGTKKYPQFLHIKALLESKRYIVIGICEILKVYSGSWFLSFFFFFLEPTPSYLIKTCKWVQQLGLGCHKAKSAMNCIAWNDIWQKKKKWKPFFFFLWVSVIKYLSEMYHFISLCNFFNVWRNLFFVIAVSTA